MHNLQLGTWLFVDGDMNKIEDFNLFQPLAPGASLQYAQAPQQLLDWAPARELELSELTEHCSVAIQGTRVTMAPIPRVLPMIAAMRQILSDGWIAHNNIDRVPRNH